MKIQDVEYTLLKDYDKGKYSQLTFPGKLTYLKERVQLILLRPCSQAMETALQSDLGLILTTAICAGISAGATFLKGQRAPKGKDGAYFLEFVNKYMDPVLQHRISGGTTWAEWLYSDVRCGLAHNFAVENGGIELQVASYVDLKPYGPEINPQSLLRDFSKAWSKYLSDAEKDGPRKDLGRLFESRFDQVFHD